MRPRAMLGLLPADLRRLARDELLVWMPALPLAMALAALLCAGLGTLALRWLSRSGQ